MGNNVNKAESSSLSSTAKPNLLVETPLPFVPKLSLAMEVCASFTAGNCRFGELCQFIHVDPLQAPPPPPAPVASVAPAPVPPAASVVPEPCRLFEIGQCA